MFCSRSSMGQNMPEISRFFGMVIAMFYSDHSPPHFHVRYGRSYGVRPCSKTLWKCKRWTAIA